MKLSGLFFEIGIFFEGIQVIDQYPMTELVLILHKRKNSAQSGVWMDQSYTPLIDPEIACN